LVHLAEHRQQSSIQIASSKTVVSVTLTGQNVCTVNQSKLACSHLKLQVQLLRRSCNSKGEGAYVRMLDLQAVLPVRRQHISVVPHVPYLQNTQIAASAHS